MDNDEKSELQAFIMCATDALNTTICFIMGVIASGLANHIVLVTSLMLAISGALSMSSGEYTSNEPLSGWKSAIGASITGFVSFIACSLIPILPFFWLIGVPAMILSTVLGTIVLFMVGAIGARFTNKSVIRNGIRQVILGLIIVSISYRLGLQIGG